MILLIMTKGKMYLELIFLQNVNKPTLFNAYFNMVRYKIMNTILIQLKFEKDKKNNYDM